MIDVEGNRRVIRECYAALMQTPDLAARISLLEPTKHWREPRIEVQLDEVNKMAIFNDNGSLRVDIGDETEFEVEEETEDYLLDFLVLLVSSAASNKLEYLIRDTKMRKSKIIAVRTDADLLLGESVDWNTNGYLISKRLP